MQPGITNKMEDKMLKNRKVYSVLLITLILPAIFQISQSYAGPLEVPGSRGENLKRFLNDNGTMTDILYTIPVHYKDSEGVWNEIDTTIKQSDETGFGFMVKKNIFKTFFARAANGEHLINYRDIWFKFQPVKSQNSQGVINQSSVIYTDAWQNTDLVYAVCPNCLKETIILKQKMSPHEFKFKISSNTSSIRQNGKSYQFSSESGDCFELQSCYMVDAAGKISNDVDMIVEQFGKDQFVKISPDLTWLQTAAFPVIIDPTVAIRTGAGSLSRCVDSGSPNSISSYICVKGSQTGNQRSLVKFDLSSIPNTIISANFGMYLYANNNPSFNGNLDYYRNTSSWTSTVTWNTKPTCDTTLITTIPTQNRAAGWCNVDITAIAEGWRQTPSSNYGILLKARCEGYPPGGENLVFVGFDHPFLGEIAMYPKLEVTYAADTTALPAPTGLTLKGYNEFTEIGWTDPAATDIERINIYRSTDPNFTPDSTNKAAEVQPVGASYSETYYDTTGITNGTTYYYTLIAEDKSSNISPATSKVSVTPVSTAAYSCRILDFSDTINNKAYGSNNNFGSPGIFGNPPAGGETEYSTQEYAAITSQDAPIHTSSTDPNEDLAKCAVKTNVQRYKFRLPMDISTIKNFQPEIRMFPEALTTTTLRMWTISSPSYWSLQKTVYYGANSMTDADKFRTLSCKLGYSSSMITNESGSNYVTLALYSDTPVNDHIDFARLGVRYINPDMKWYFKITVSIDGYITNGSSFIGVAPDGLDTKDPNDMLCPPCVGSNVMLSVNRSSWSPCGEYIGDIIKPFVGSKQYTGWRVILSSMPTEDVTCTVNWEAGTGVHAPPPGTYTLVDLTANQSYNIGLSSGSFTFQVHPGDQINPARTLRFDCNIQ